MLVTFGLLLCPYLVAQEGKAGERAEPEKAELEKPEKPVPEPEKAPEKPKKKPHVRHVSGKPLDILYRFFELTDSQSKEQTELRAKLNAERAELMRKMDEELNARYAELVLAMLTDEQKQEFTKIREAITAYEAARQAAQDEFGKFYEEVTGSPLARFPYSVDQLLYGLPSLSQEEKRNASKAAMSIRRASYKEVEAALKESGITRPKNNRDREAWQEYSQARGAIHREIAAKNSQKITDAIRSTLAPDMQEKFGKLTAAYEKAREGRDGTSSELAEQLDGIVGAERMKPKYPAYQYYRQGGQTQGARGGQAPKKVQKAPKTEAKVF